MALSDEKQSTKGWATGAVGEERLGARLDSLVARSIAVLHDRRFPGTRANIDHIAITTAGIWVIDAKPPCVDRDSPPQPLCSRRRTRNLARNGSSSRWRRREDGRPVIAVAGWNSYPAAQITGQVRLVQGCLLIGNSVVFWAAGASWDVENRAVELQDAEPVHVGDNVSGGGGHYMPDDLDGLAGVDAAAVFDCLRRTGSDDAVLATAS